MREVELFIQADQLFTDRVAAIAEDQWDKQVPATPDWSVRQLVNHVAQNNVNMISFLEGGEADAPEDVLGDEPVASWNRVAKTAEGAAGSQEDYQVAVGGPTGDTTKAGLIIGNMVDRLIHSWDLASAIGDDTDLPESLVQAAHDLIEPNIEQMRLSGIIGAAVEVGPDATLQERFLAMTGRDPGYEHTESIDEDEKAEEIHRS